MAEGPQRSFAIAVDLGDIIPPGGLTKEDFPNLAAAVLKITQAAHGQWSRFAEGVPLPSGRSIPVRTPEYANNILYRMTGDFSGEVYNDLPIAHVIEDGAPAYDMKKMLGSSLKVRVDAKGKRYLIIPFRHYHPNAVIGAAMPQSVHDWWHAEKRTQSTVDGIGERQSGTGAYDIKTRAPLMVPQRKYTWGTKLSKSTAEGLGLTKQQASRVAGMYNFRKPEGGPGYGQHSQFITFRVMHESSKGWIRPAREGLHPAQVTAELIRPVAEEAFKRAVAADVAAHTGGKSST